MLRRGRALSIAKPIVRGSPRAGRRRGSSAAAVEQQAPVDDLDRADARSAACSAAARRSPDARGRATRCRGTGVAGDHSRGLATRTALVNVAKLLRADDRACRALSAAPPKRPREPHAACAVAVVAQRRRGSRRVAAHVAHGRSGALDGRRSRRGRSCAGRPRAGCRRSSTSRRSGTPVADRPDGREVGRQAAVVDADDEAVGAAALEQRGAAAGSRTAGRRRVFVPIGLPLS